MASVAVIAAIGGCESSPLTSTDVIELPAEQLLVVPSEAVVGVGYTVRLLATPMTMAGDSVAGYEITWTSSDDAIASVSTDGLVTALSFGTATITATAEQTGKGHGKANAPGQLKKNAKIVVDTAQVASVDVTPAASQMIVGSAVQHSATATDADGNVLTGRYVAWSSSNASVATVDATGLVAGVSTGTATISATVDGETGTATATVETAQPPPNNRPSAPSGLALAQTDSSIIVTWADNADNEDGFEIERTLEADFNNWQPYATRGANTQSIEDKALTVNVEYCYRVRAYNADGASPFATNPDYVCKRFQPSSPPPPPPPPPGASEPIFDAATHNSLWHDDFSSYSSKADMQSGAGAHPWNGQWGLWSLNTGGRNGTRYMRHNFQGAGQYGDEIYAADDELAGQDPPVVIMTMWVRNVGTQYWGKMQVQKSNGSGRWVFVMTSNNPYSLDLTGTYWDIYNHQGNTYPALDPSQSLPTYTAYGATLNRDMDCAGFPTWSYKQNRNWGNIKPPQSWNDGNWHRWTVRWTKGGGTGPCGDGHGRIEWWWDGVLIQQWLGDDPTRPEYGYVYTAGSGSRVVFDPAYFGPSRFNWPGGAYVDLDEIRYFTLK